MNLLLVYLLPLGVLIYLSIQWFRYGRDPENRKNIAPQYAPPKGITPAEAGVVIDEKADPQDIMATLFDLATRRHFLFEDLGEDVKLILIQDYEDDTGLEKHEKALMKSVFGRKEMVMLSEIAGFLKERFGFIKSELYDAVARKGFFEKNPELARSNYFRIGLLGILLAGIALFSRDQFFESASAYWHLLDKSQLALFLSGLLFLIFSRFMPKKTKKGQQLFEHLLGLKKFLKNPVETEGMYEGYADEKTYFEKLLPYAMVVDETESWLTAKARLYQMAPPFYAKTKRNFRDFVQMIEEKLKK